MRTLFEAAIAFAALVILSPLLIAVALLVYFDSPGGAFYRARRVGRDGREFRMWKFRTMVAGADRKGGAITGPQDARVTRVGRWLRASKLDELPQLINVVTGQMSLVGPRPEAPELVAHYTPSQRVVLMAKPGITGPVQIEASDEAEQIPPGANADEYYRRHLMGPKLEADLAYLRRRWWGSDLYIVFETARLVLRSLGRRLWAA